MPRFNPRRCQQRPVRFSPAVPPKQLRGVVRSYVERIRSAMHSDRRSRFFECNELQHELRALLRRSVRTPADVRDALGSLPTEATSLLTKTYVDAALNGSGPRTLSTGDGDDSSLLFGRCLIGAAAGMIKTAAIHGPLKKGVKILLFANATVVARIVGVDGPWRTLRQAIEQVQSPPPVPFVTCGTRARARSLALSLSLPPLTNFFLPSLLSAAVGRVLQQLFGLRIGAGIRLQSRPEQGAPVCGIQAASRAGAGPPLRWSPAPAGGRGFEGAGGGRGAFSGARGHARASPPGHDRLCKLGQRPFLCVPHRGNIPVDDNAVPEEPDRRPVRRVQLLSRPRSAQRLPSPPCRLRAQSQPSGATLILPYYYHHRFRSADGVSG